MTAHVPPAPDLSRVGTPELIAALEARFQRTPGQPLPLDMFLHVMGWFPSVTGEMFAVRRANDGLQILLVNRQSTDVGYAGTCHMPGKFQLLDETVQQNVARVVKNEIGLDPWWFDSHFIGITNNPFEERGHNVHVIHQVDIKDPFNLSDEHPPLKAHWVNLRQLPDNIVVQHLPMIYSALEVYLGQQKPGFVIEYQPVTELEVANAHDYFLGDLTNASKEGAVRIIMARMGELDYWRGQIVKLLDQAGM